MSQPLWDIEKYVLESGDCPFDEWFDSLTPKTQARVDVRLDRLRLGNFGDHKPVGDGVWELRLDFGPGYRLYYAQVGRWVVLLLVGGDKSSQGKDIKLAKLFWLNVQKESGAD